MICTYLDNFRIKNILYTNWNKGEILMSKYNINTICVQGGYEPKNGEPRVVPIVQSTTFKYESSQ